MRAAIHDRYGPPEVLHIEDVPAPVPADTEILVRVHAATMNRSDCHMRGAYPAFWRLILGIRRPRRRVSGMEFAGVVEQVGSGVSEFKVGDEVMGLRWTGGGHAELVTIGARKLVAHKPPNVTFEQAAATPDGFINAINCLHQTRVGPGMSVVIYGASGSIGTAAVQLAKHMGARVTAVCSTSNVELVRSLGPDQVLDYTAGEDFTNNREAYDVVVDAVGRHSFMRSRRSLKPGGRFTAADGAINIPLMVVTRIGSKRVVAPVARTKPDDLALMTRLLENGEYRPVIDRTYPLDEIVEAARYVETRRKRGNVVLTITS